MLLKAHAAASETQIPFDGSFTHSDIRSRFKDTLDKKTARQKLAEIKQDLDRLQRPLYAGRAHSVLLIFQALDAAGKDGTIRAVFSGLDPAGVVVSPFKAPTELELRHDFLWRTTLCLPPRGVIGVFNRSYYEEVLTVQVHPEYLNSQYPAGVPDLEQLWVSRYAAIREHEKHLADSGTLILKFWLNVSPEEQRDRFLSRLNEPRKQWKFNHRDVEEAGHRAAYDDSFVRMVNETSRPCAPWYQIPADDKPSMRVKVAEIVRDSLASLNPSYPAVKPDERADFDHYRLQLENSATEKG